MVKMGNEILMYGGTTITGESGEIYAFDLTNKTWRRLITVLKVMEAIEPEESDLTESLISMEKTFDKTKIKRRTLFKNKDKVGTMLAVGVEVNDDNDQSIS